MLVDILARGRKTVYRYSSPFVIRLAEHLVLRLRFCTPCRFAAISGTRRLHRWARDHPALAEVVLICSQTPDVQMRKRKAHCHGGGTSPSQHVFSHDARVTGSGPQQ